jgi:two-component system OmpR family sensor kinase
MNKNSIIFKITLFFVVMIITTHLIIFFGYNLTKQQQIDINVNKYRKTLHRVTKNIMDKNHPPFEEEFVNGSDDKNFFFRPPPPPPPRNRKHPFESFFDESVMNQGLKIYDLEISNISYDKLKKIGKFIASDEEWEMYEYKGFRYFYVNDKFRKVLLKDNTENIENTDYILYLTILLNIVFVVFYVFLIQKLQPLQKLKNDIVKFSKGDLDIDTSCIGKDEISEVSNEFDKAIKEIKLLTNSRNLFLRNIMHELKTPITKGLLISNMMEDSKFKTSLKKAFFRLEYLLNEFARIEEFTSKNIKVDKEEFRIIDVIDHSLDILLCDIDAIDLEVVDNILVKVDYELFALAIKNLLDNAIKYGKGKPKVIIKDNTLFIKSIGKELCKPIQEYNKPFNKKYENSNSGLGLGLYIVNHILNAHNFNLKYKHENGENIFKISFTSI